MVITDRISTKIRQMLRKRNLRTKFSVSKQTVRYNETGLAANINKNPTKQVSCRSSQLCCSHLHTCGLYYSLNWVAFLLSISNGFRQLKRGRHDDHDLVSSLRV